MFSPYQRMYWAGFLLDFAIAMALVAMPFYVFNQLNGTVITSGLFGAASSAGYALMCIFLSYFVSKAKNGLNWALTGIGIFAIPLVVVMFTRELWLCSILFTIGFSGMAAVWPALHAWIGSDPNPDKRIIHVGWFNIAWSAGLASGPLLAGPLIDWDFRFCFWAIFLVAVAGFLLVWSLPHEKLHFESATEEQLIARADFDLASEAHLYTAWSATLIANFLVGISRSVFPKRIDELVRSEQLRLFWETNPPAYFLGNQATIYSWTAFGISLTTAVVFYFMGRTSAWKHNFIWLALVQIISAVAFWSLGYTKSLAMMWCASAVLGVGIGFAFFASVNYSLANPKRKHQRTTINEAMVGIGGCLGSIIFGYLVANYGFAGPFQWTPLFIVVLVFLEWRFLLRKA